MTVVPSHSLAFLQRKQLISRAAQIQKRSSAAHVTPVLRVFASRTPGTSLHSGNFDCAPGWPLLTPVKYCFPPPPERCRETLWSSHPSCWSLRLSRHPPQRPLCSSEVRGSTERPQSLRSAIACVITLGRDTK